MQLSCASVQAYRLSKLKPRDQRISTGDCNVAARAPRPELPERVARRRFARRIPTGSDACLVLAADPRSNLHRASGEPAKVGAAACSICPLTPFDGGCRAVGNHGALPTIPARVRVRMDAGFHVDCRAAGRNRTPGVAGLLYLALHGFRAQKRDRATKKHPPQAFAGRIRCHGTQRRNPDVGELRAAATVHDSGTTRCALISLACSSRHLPLPAPFCSLTCSY
jgi:hypothetical protein